MDEGIYNIKKKLETQIKKIKESDKISEKDKELILKFYDECYSQGLSDTRVLFYVSKLWMLAHWCDKDFDQLTKEDIKSLVRRIETNNYTEWTKQNYKVTIKKFWQWLDGYEWRSKEYPDKVKWISLAIKNNNNKSPEILTKEEIKKLVKACSNLRDRALVSVLYESGCRIGELLGMRIKDVDFDDYGAIISVTGKKGSRRIRLISSVPHISNWLENHPNKDDKNAFLWTTITNKNHGNRISYQYARTKLKELAEKVKIQKDVNPHNFRHSRATHLANKLTEAQMKILFGWTQASKMAATYVHLSGRDVDNAILRIHGKLSKEEEKKEEELKAIECPRCHHENSPESDFCGRCRLPLNEKVAMELKEREKEFLKMITPEMIEEMIEKKVQEILKNKK